jgi:hypothetical protein
VIRTSDPHPRSAWIAADARGGAKGHVLWLAGALVLSFMTAFIGVSILALPRDVFVLLHVATSGVFVLSYARWAQLDVRMFSVRLWTGLLAGGAASVFSVVFVLSQPGSVGPTDVSLLWSILWLGIVYGALDALLLTVLPVTAAWAISGDRATRGIGAAISVGAASLAASATVTAAYHLGFPEFRGPELAQPLIGNTIITLAYLLSGNRASPIFAHIVLHVASVFHAYGTSIPLPPHYSG